MTARIYQPTKSAMQSGKGKASLWILEYIPSRYPHIEPIMGWTGGGDTLSCQVRLKFNSKDKAIQYADKNSIQYVIVSNPDSPPLILKSYVNNFKNNKK